MPTLRTNYLPRYLGDSVQHIIAIYTAAVPDKIQTINTADGCPHKTLFTQQPFKSRIGYIHCCRVYTKNRYLHGSRSRAKSVIYIAAGCIHRLLLPRQPFKSQLGYIHCCRVYIHEIVIYTASVPEPNRLGDYRSADRGLFFTHIKSWFSHDAVHFKSGFDDSHNLNTWDYALIRRCNVFCCVVIFFFMFRLVGLV